MGGRKQGKKKIIDKEMKEASVFSNHSAPARNIRKADLGAVIFGCKHSTIKECLLNQLFGLPASHYSYIRNISPGLVLFLFNYSDWKLHGIFEATSPGQMNFNKYAWAIDGDGTEYTTYPAQVRIRVRQQCQPLSEDQFGPIIADNYYEKKHFYFELDHDQTNKLMLLFASSPVNIIPSSSQNTTRSNNLFSSWPVPTKIPVDSGAQNWKAEAGFDHADKTNEKGSSLDAPPPLGMTNLLEPTVGVEVLAENPNQTSKLSYASVLSNISTTTAAATSSLPPRKWSALFKTQSAFESTNEDEDCRIQASYASFSASDVSNTIPQSSWVTTCCPDSRSIQVSKDQSDKLVARSYDGRLDELPPNQEYEDKADYLQANTWEESQFIATTDVECVQAWASDSTAHAKTTTDKYPPNLEYADKADFLQANTWEDSRLIATTPNEVECVQIQVSDSSPQHSEELSSPQPAGQFPSSGVPFPDDANDMHNYLSEAPLDDSPNCNRSSFIETNESNVEANHEKDSSLVPNSVTQLPNNLESLVVKLMQEVEGLKGSLLKQMVKTNLLEQGLVESKLEIQQLRNQLSGLESGSRSITDPAEVDYQLPSKSHSKFVDSVFIVGGYNGSSWLPTLDSYFPSHDIKTSLRPMKFLKKYASAATLNSELYHFGGMGSHTVESFSPTRNQWVPRPPLYWKNIHVAGASLRDRLFAVGGGNGLQCSSEVEYLDLNFGKWLPTRSMQSKRLAPAAVELNNALYVVGGYDGITYLSCAERFDPRKEAWYKLPSMNTKRGCHSLVVLNEKLYALGGFDGDKYVPTMEFLDPRMGSWVNTEPMSVSRGSFGAFVLGGKLYAIGGSKENDKVLDIVECYEEGGGWEVADLKAIGKRSHFSAIVF